MRFLLPGLALLAAVALLFDPAKLRVAAPAPSLPPAPASPQPFAPITVGGANEAMRSADSHFYVDAQVNGARVRMMLDTGASSVVLTKADALAAGIGAAEGEFTAPGRGAGGPVKLKPVRIARLAVGDLAAHDVPAMVVEGALPVSLLGQSYLGRLRSVEITGDRLILR